MLINTILLWTSVNSCCKLEEKQRLLHGSNCVETSQDYTAPLSGYAGCHKDSSHTCVYNMPFSLQSWAGAKCSIYHDSVTYLMQITSTKETVVICLKTHPCYELQEDGATQSRGTHGIYQEHYFCLLQISFPPSTRQAPWFSNNSHWQVWCLTTLSKSIDQTYVFWSRICKPLQFLQKTTT